MPFLSSVCKSSKTPFQVMDAVMRGEYGTEEVAELMRSAEVNPPDGAVLHAYLKAIYKNASYMLHADAFEKPLVDIAGTGGDGMKTANISTLASLIVASSGLVAVTKYGNRSASGICGSMDVLEALGIPIELSQREVADNIREHGFAPLFARSVYPGARFVAEARKNFGRPSLFNLLFPLARPVEGDVRFIFGCATEYQMDAVEKILLEKENVRCLLVRGFDGTDELSVAGAGKTHYRLIDAGTVTQGVLDVREVFGIEPVPLSLLQIETKEGAVGLFQNALDQSTDIERVNAVRTAGLANAAMLLFLALDTGRDIQRAARYLPVVREALSSGSTLQLVHNIST